MGKVSFMYNLRQDLNCRWRMFSLFSLVYLASIMETGLVVDAFLVKPSHTLSSLSQTKDSFLNHRSKSLLYVVKTNKFEWEDYVSALKEYSKNQEDGNVNVPQNYLHGEERMKLGLWVHNQRTAYSCALLEGTSVETEWGSVPLRLSLYQMAQLDAIGFIWDVPEYEWNQNYQILMDYKEKHGHVLVPQSYQTINTNINLGKWVANQRQLHRSGKMSWKRKIKLEQIGFSWDGKAKSQTLSPTNYTKKKRRNGKLLQYTNATSWGDQKWYESYNIFKSHPSQKEKLTGKLERWAKQQKYHYNLYVDGRNSTRLTMKRKESLDDINFMSWMASYEWYIPFQELSELYRSSKIGDKKKLTYSLRRWVKEQKLDHYLAPVDESSNEMNMGLQNVQKRKLLDSINFFQREATPKEVEFHENLNKLQEFYQRHNHCVVPKTEVVLSKWVQKQRLEYMKVLSKGKKATLLTEQIIQKLDSMQFVWDPDDAIWYENYFQCLEVLSCSEPDLLSSNINSTKLKSWIRQQHRNYKIYYGDELRSNDGNCEDKLKLNPKQANDLDNIKEIFHIVSKEKSHCNDRSLVYIDALKKFKDTHGHVIVPYSYKFDYNSTSGYKSINLGSWVRKQRTRNKEEFRRELEELGFVWCQETASWLENFLALIEFFKKCGHLDIPPSKRKLFRWVSNERKTLLNVQKKTKMTENMFSENQLDGDMIDNLTRELSQSDSEMIEKVKVRVLNRIGFIWDSKAYKEDKQWNEFYQALQLYHEKNGNCNVPARYVTSPDSIKLGSWVRKLRLDYKQNESSQLTICEEKTKKLHSLGFFDSQTNSEIAKLGKRSEQWSKRSNQLKRYIQLNGHCHFLTNDTSELSSWVKYIRSQYRAFSKDNTKSSLAQNYIDDLDRIGFVWNAKEAKWDYYLEQYKEKQQNQTKFDKSLDYWVKQQRIQYNLANKKNTNVVITEAQIKKLDEVGFEWSIPKKYKKQTSKGETSSREIKNDERWNLMYEQLVEYKDSYGNCNVPRDFKVCGDDDSMKLATWVMVQRREYRKKNTPQSKNDYITPEREEKLESIGFIWDGELARQYDRDKKWLDQYDKLQDFYNKNGHFRIPRSQGSFGIWVSNQRRIYSCSSKQRKSRSWIKKRFDLLNRINFIHQDNKESI